MPSIVLTRNAPLEVEPATWTPVPMDTVYGGDQTLHLDGYVQGAPGSWLFGAYARLNGAVDCQVVIRFARDITGDRNITGSLDFPATVGRDFVTHTWFFEPALWKPTGWELWHDAAGPVTVEYAQLKAARLHGPVSF